jgi:GNAT superfamily N-acetyltransferase
VNDTIELRQAVPEDAPAIRALTREAYAKWVPLIGREPWPMTSDYEEALRKHRFDLLYADGRLVALIETIREVDHLLIENVAVLPSFQGRGFGRRLIARAEQLAAEAGFDKVKLYTNRRFEENIRLYQRLGYRLDREEEFEGGIMVHMSKAMGSGSVSIDCKRRDGHETDHD